MFVKVTHFSSEEENEWFIVNDFYFHCKMEHGKDPGLIQHDSQAEEWISIMNNVRIVQYKYEGPRLPWYKHERNIANLIFQDMYPDGHKLKGELVGVLTKQ